MWNGACSTSDIGPILGLEKIYFEAEGRGWAGRHQLSFVSLYIGQIVFDCGVISKPTISFIIIIHFSPTLSNSHFTGGEKKKKGNCVDLKALKRAHKSLHNIFVLQSCK